MKTNKPQKPPLLLEGELHLEQICSIGKVEIKIRVLDITHVDAESILLAESIEEYSFKKEEVKIPYKIFGTEPNPSCNYIVTAVISFETDKGVKKLLYRTTQSIPVFRSGDSNRIEIPLTKMS